MKYSEKKAKALSKIDIHEHALLVFASIVDSVNAGYVTKITAVRIAKDSFKLGLAEAKYLIEDIQENGLKNWQD